MNEFNDKEYLKNVQYATSENLEARIALHQRYTPLGKDYLDFVWDRYSFKSNEKVLEVGCGNGLFWTHHPPSNFPSIYLTITDISEGMLRSAEENLADIETDIAYEMADVEQLPYTDNTYDVALAHFMLYHVPSQSNAVDEIKRVLKPEGWTGIILVAKGSMSAIFEAGQHVAPELNSLNPTSHIFTDEDAERLLDSKFNSVEKHVYRHIMKVDDGDIIVRYAQSSPSFLKYQLPDRFWGDYTDYVCGVIAETGAFEVTKRFVLFICRDQT